MRLSCVLFVHPKGIDETLVAELPDPVIAQIVVFLTVLSGTEIADAVDCVSVNIFQAVIFCDHGEIPAAPGDLASDLVVVEFVVEESDIGADSALIVCAFSELPAMERTGFSPQFGLQLLLGYSGDVDLTVCEFKAEKFDAFSGRGTDFFSGIDAEPVVREMITDRLLVGVDLFGRVRKDDDVIGVPGVGDAAF